MLLLSVSLALIYNGKAIHLQLPAYLMVTLNHNIKYYCKVLLLEKGQRKKKGFGFHLAQKWSQ